MIDDPTREELRGLFDWRNAAARPERPGGTAASGGESNDLALALQLLSCNSRDREQFVGARGSTATRA